MDIRPIRPAAARLFPTAHRVTALAGPPARPAVQAVLDRAVADGGLPGVLAGIHAPGGRWYGTAGVADTATGRPRGAADHFRIGSITKTFVATVMLRLVAEHAVSLDDTVETWLPGLVTGGGHDGWRVTIRRLLNHTSGIFNYTNDPGALSVEPTYSPRRLVEIAMGHPASFAPGDGWEYSNTNYVLAGMIIEKAGRAPLAEQIAAHITEPLDLPGTYLPTGDDETLPAPHSRHYTALHDPSPDAVVHDITEMNTTPYWAAGAMVSTVDDLDRFLAALLGGKLLPHELRREMFTTVPTHDWIDGTRYGLGVTSLTLPGGTELWGMGGAIFGSWTYAYGDRDGSRVLSVNTNGDRTTGGGWDDPIAVFTDVLTAEFTRP
ncbi:serine hydrolase domain-containing protein [Phytomonospora endophytica]|uniref:D-alanyl-D-alanine carboxypeptidase n=1 Tax=Phytomonospora endophytica TaxID=714109 RepID=A0A841FVU5_9ACTN|nr:serine hydrolase domain-containing protein [Phytomonospora endophytica]MBB6038883.1 D-alanyl-D-alanine carboxypeptidase [Phytomonospora endophytica]GIG68322.1 D-alanyl-D-alanine carboxypeptidase [Phytomonospora endophytica]